MPNNQSKITLITVTLPDHLITDHILPRLPVKTLLKFTTVCKSWQATIFSLTFTKSHLTFSSLTHPQILLQTKPHPFNYNKYSPDYNISLIPYDNNENTLQQQTHPLVTPLVTTTTTYDDIVPIKIVGCCDGLVCLFNGNNGYGYFCVWNPATREFSEIANCVRAKAMCNAFGYVGCLDDYCIVSWFDCGHADCRFYVYSLRQGEWKRVCWLESLGILLDIDPVMVEGVVYFQAAVDKNKGNNRGVNRVVGFEIASERVEEKGCVWGRMFGMGGRLMFYCARGIGTEVYVMKNDGWEVYKYIGRSVSEVGVDVFFMESGKILIRGGGMLKLVDSSLDECEFEDEERVSLNDEWLEIDSVWNYSESLVSPFGNWNEEGVLG